MTQDEHAIPKPLIFLSSGLGILLLAALLVVPLLIVPIEDAAILHIFSRNLAETGTISYITGGPRAEGATDFLWMVYIALGMKLHVGAAFASAVANVFSAIGLCWVLLKLAGVRSRWAKLLPLLGLLLLFPQIESALDGFCVLPFVFGIALLAYLVQGEANRAAASALTALLVCLVRPDGVVFAVPLLVWSLLIRFSWRKLWLDSALFVLPGAIYFLWRRHYFGEFFPLPFLVKSDTHGLNWTSDFRAFLLFAVVLLAVALGKKAFEKRNAGLLITLLVLPTLFYLRMRLDQNVGARFYFYLVIGALLILAQNWRSLSLPRQRTTLWIGLAAWVVLVARSTGFIMLEVAGDQPKFRNRRDVAVELSQVQPRGTMMATEAGLFPYFSRWPSIDPWGLNTAQFAKHFVQPQDVVRLHPDVIVFQTVAATPESCNAKIAEVRGKRDWDYMVANLQTGIAETGNYSAWALPDVRNVIGARLKPKADRLYVTCWYVSREYASARAAENVLQEHHALELQTHPM